jgi:hypothetical protein
MIPVCNDTTNLSKTEFRLTQDGIDLNEKKNIIIDEIILFDGSITMINSENIVFQNGEVSLLQLKIV